MTARNLALLSAILASSMAFIDGTALNVALPRIQQALALSGVEMLWVVNGYTLFLASLMLAGGALGDVYGKKKVFQWGIIVFTLTSAGCGLSQDGLMLIILRMAQGVGGALMVPGSLALITAVFPREERGRAIGTWSMFSAFTTILGPVLGGYLADIGLWRMVFFINVPLGLLASWLLSRVQEPVRQEGRQLDWVGALLATVGTTSAVFAFLQAGEKGFQTPLILFTLGFGLVLLLVFIWWESRASDPMLPLSLFQSPTFSAANFLTLLVYGALGAALFFLPLNLIQVQGYASSTAGFAILPFGGLIALLARLSGSWTDRVGPKLPLTIGPLITGVAFFSFSFIGQTPGPSTFWTTFFPVLTLAGVGMGLTVVPLTTAVMQCVTEKDSGIASGVNNTISRLANVLLLAILGAVALLLFKEGLLHLLSESGLTSDQLQYMRQQAGDLAAASPADEWSDRLQEITQKAVKSTFIATFNIVTRIAGVVCMGGGLIAALFVRKNPKIAHT